MTAQSLPRRDQVETDDPWHLIPVEEREIYKAAGYGASVQLGKNPALLILDATYNFTGDRPEPIMESIKRFANSCGENAWRSLEAIAELQRAFRSIGRPVVMTRASRKTRYTVGGWIRTNTRATDITGDDPGEEFADIIAPENEDILVEKTKPSAFFGTPLVSILNEVRVDTLLIGGGTTSGCVRASVLDAFSYGYRVAVVREATFDRASVPHTANLFDMDQKYANVTTLSEAKSYLAGVVSS